MKYSLSSEHRLNDAQDFTRVLAKRPINGCCFRIRAVQSGAKESRLGLIVAKRAVPKAVDRHRLKRLMREYFRCHRQQLDTMDIVITALPEAAHHSNQEIRQCLHQLWHKLIKRHAPAAVS
jgi:ribonuclease P protein component